MRQRAPTWRINRSKSRSAPARVEQAVTTVAGARSQRTNLNVSESCPTHPPKLPGVIDPYESGILRSALWVDHGVDLHRLAQWRRRDAMMRIRCWINIGALACNLAWESLTASCTMGCLSEQGRGIRCCMLRKASQPRGLTVSLPQHCRPGGCDAQLAEYETLRQKLVHCSSRPRPRLRKDEWLGASRCSCGFFLLHFQWRSRSCSCKTSRKRCALQRHRHRAAVCDRLCVWAHLGEPPVADRFGDGDSRCGVGGHHDGFGRINKMRKLLFIAMTLVFVGKTQRLGPNADQYGRRPGDESAARHC